MESESSQPFSQVTQSTKTVMGMALQVLQEVLFKDQLWIINYPIAARAPDQPGLIGAHLPPPSSQKTYKQIHLNDFPKDSMLHKAVTAVESACNDLFFGDSGHPILHNQAFWAHLSNQVAIDIVWLLESASEAEMKLYLISPLLKSISRSMSSYSCSGTSYVTSVRVEYQTKEQDPQIDFIMKGMRGGEILFQVPVEVKKDMINKDMGQLADYMGSLMTLSSEHMTVGILIDGVKYRMAFSPFMLKCGDGKEIPLPIVAFSPMVIWRGCKLEMGAIATLCVLHQLMIKRMVVLEEELKSCFSEKVANAIIAKAHAIQNECKPESKPVIVQSDLLQIIGRMGRKVEAYEEKMVAYEQKIATYAGKVEAMAAELEVFKSQSPTLKRRKQQGLAED